MTDTPRCNRFMLSNRQVARPQEGLFVVAYQAEAARDGESHSAHCTSTHRRLSHEARRVVQHQQTPSLRKSG